MRRHLSDQQLVDFVIGASSRVEKLSAGQHLATCSFCREDLDNLRSIDRQLELQGGTRRLAALPRTRSAVGETPWTRPVQPELPPAAARGAALGWQRSTMPLVAAVCCLFAVKATLERAGPPAPARSRGIQMAAFSAEPSRPIVCAHEMEARSFPESDAATPAATEIRSPAVASTKQADAGFVVPQAAKPAPAAWATRVTAAAPHRARAPRVRQRADPTAARVLSHQHPGAGNNDDSISPPSRGV